MCIFSIQSSHSFKTYIFLFQYLNYTKKYVFTKDQADSY